MSKHNDDYIPIDCGLHSEYELAIMHKKKGKLTWYNSNHLKEIQTVEPIDIFTQDKKEYLKIRGLDNSVFDIRLDKIITFIF